MTYAPALAIFMTVTSLHSIPALPSCPGSPNCVSSQAGDRHHIEPFAIAGDPGRAFNRLRQILMNRADTTVISFDDTTITVEFRTALGFVDDGTFLLDAADNLIHIRSAARLGYWDMGKNRRRMEEIRRSFLAENP
jgi:uncharacterized protein (DUF1499 family)